jgi:5-methylcytosine-specific restriction protein A
MATAAPRVCSHRGCNRLTDGGPRCELHPHEPRRERTKQDRAYDERRGSAASRGYDWRWQRLRLGVLSEEPLCRSCRAAGRVTAATEVDHIEPLERAPERRLERSNLQPLCHACHVAKTAEDRKTPRGD